MMNKIRRGVIFTFILLVFLINITYLVLAVDGLTNWNPTLGPCPVEENGRLGPEYSFLRLYAINSKGEEFIRWIADTGGTQQTNALCNANTFPVLGKNDVNHPLDFSYGELDDVCADASYNYDDGGPEGVYSFRMESDGSDEENVSYCILDGLGVEWNSYGPWCTNNFCGRGKYDAGLGDDDACCSPREMDAEFNYTNEDCNWRSSNSSFLCYFDLNSTWEGLSSMQTVAWLDGQKFLGEIVYEGCGDVEDTNQEDGFEYLAIDGPGRWAKCTDAGFEAESSILGDIVEVTGSDFQTDAILTHEYICIDRLAPRKYSIGECRGNSSERHMNGQTNEYQASGLNFLGSNSANLSDSNVYFCTALSTWSTDLDDYDLAGENGQYCKTAKFPQASYDPYSSSPGLGATYVKIGDWVPQSSKIDWTGTYCCGEPDDWSNTYPDKSFNVNNEYYTDDDRLPGSHASMFSNSGACFNSVPQLNQTFLKIYNNESDVLELKEVMVWHGTLQGCAIDHEAALASKQTADFNEGKLTEEIKCAYDNDLNKPYGGTFGQISASDYGYYGEDNDFLMDLVDQPNKGGGGASQGALIYDNEYCNTKNWSGVNHFFCSYKEVWEEYTPDNSGLLRNHLSFMPWDDPLAQQAECCTVNECWNGSECISSVLDDDTISFVEPHKIMNRRGDGFICKDGNWEWTYKKQIWDGSEDGYCLNNTQCLLTPDGDYSVDNSFGPLHYAIDEVGDINTPACINDGEFYLDHYCENGSWTSRTKYVGLQLYNLAEIQEGADFTLYCDNYDKVLNQVGYSITYNDLNIMTKYFKEESRSNCKTFDKQLPEPCVNHLCVLVKDPNSENPEVFIGTSINHRLNMTLSEGGQRPIYDFGNALGSSLSTPSCIQAEGKDDTLINCGDTNVFFNGKRSVVLFARNRNLQQPDYFTTLNNLFTNFIMTLIDQMVGSQSQVPVAGFDYSLLDDLADDLYHSSSYAREYNIPDFECENCSDNKAGPGAEDNRDEVCADWGNPRKVLDLNTFYLSKIGSKKIFGLAEYEADFDNIPLRFYGISYEGFSENICDSFRQTGAGSTTYKCEENSNRYYVSAKVEMPPSIEISYNSLVDILYGEQWVFLAPSTRVQG